MMAICFVSFFYRLIKYVLISSKNDILEIFE
jgi:hypothetical protein